VVFPAGWDRRDRWTLRFVDPELERLYQHADHAEGVRRVRTASFVAVGAWVLVALIGPPVVGVAPGPIWLISGLVIFILLVSAGVSQWATTQRRRDAIGMGNQLAAGVAVLGMATVTGMFAPYALPGVMVTAVFGFSITRHPFTGAVVMGIAYCLLFVVFALALGLASHLPFQVLILAIAVVAACVGGYTLERSQRTAFAQGRLVSALRDQVDQLLHRYLSPEVASSLIEDPGRAALGGEELEVTVLFADLRGYTAFAEHRAPAQVVAMLNDAFGVVVPIVFAEGGTVVQFMGDALMAIFNAPHPQPDHALRAARAALAMQRAVNELPTADSHPQFRVGLNSGPALVGNIGGAEMRNFAAIGDTTNLAARLQTYAAEGSVVIGAITYDLIREHAVVRPLGSPELRGKSQPVEAYELLSLRGGGSRDNAARIDAAVTLPTRGA
jgi:class 3 adenylate cyclase